MSWEWWVAQGFAFLGLIFVIISFQQKSTKKLIWFRSIATWLVFAGLFFLGDISAIIMCGAGVLRNAVSMYFAYRPETKIRYKYISGALIVVLLVILNIVFWKSYLNIYSMVLGSVNVYTFLQSTPKRIRYCSVVAEILAIVYYSILFTPINISIEAFGLISAIVGIIRLDIKKHNPNNEIKIIKNTNNE